MAKPRRAAPPDPERDYWSSYPAEENRSFGRSLGATVASAIIPGLGLVSSKRRAIRLFGWLFTSLFVLGVIAAAVYTWMDPAHVASVVVRPRVLRVLVWALPVVAVIWVTIITTTHLVRRPQGLTAGYRMLGGLLVGVLSLAISTPLAVAARYSLDQARLVETIFQGSESKSQTRPTLEGKTAQDVWKNKPRLNVLLLGSDMMEVRKQIHDRPILTDTIMVASIDTHSGDVVLIQVPRNMERTPFPPGSKLAQLMPNGWVTHPGGDPLEYMANTIWQRVPQYFPNALGPSDFPGADAMKLAIGEAVGLPIDYFMMVNIDGLQKFIDAIGGVRVNINSRISVGGTNQRPESTQYWLEKGPNQLLNGYDAMWYARGRLGFDDFSRMSRQSCLIDAVIKQTDVPTMMTSYEAIADASKDMVQTDIPQSALPAFVELALRVKNGSMRRVLFENGVNGFVSSHPNFELMRQQVRDAIAGPPPAATTAPPQPSGTSTPSSTKTKQPGKKPTTNPQPNVDMKDACAYHP